VKEKGKITRHIIPREETREFCFLGIVTSEPDYRLSVMLNKQLGIALHHDLNDLVDGTAEDAPHFSVFSTSPLILSLVSNKSNGNFLIRKLKNIDFFLVIYGVHDRKKAETLACDIRNNSNVTAVFVFESSKVSDKNIALLLNEN
jgi:hypothetical protein